MCDAEILQDLGRPWVTMRRHRGDVKHSFYGGGRGRPKKKTPVDFWTGALDKYINGQMKENALEKRERESDHPQLRLVEDVIRGQETGPAVRI